MTQRANLPPALSGDRRILDTMAGAVSYYVLGDNSKGRPLLLVHSVNAAASAYEAKPIYDRYGLLRPVYALDLPGFGLSARTERRYTPRLMTDAILALVEEMRRKHGDAPIDALAISLGCEFLVRAAHGRPEAFRRIVLVSPTGLDRRSPRDGSPGSNRGNALLHRMLTIPLWSRGLFALLTTPLSIRYFLRKTFGSHQIDEGLADYDYRTSHWPGAHHAPYDFVSGYLFSADIAGLYRLLTLPVLLVHGTRGDFTDYSHKNDVMEKANWRSVVLKSGALPHFERPREFFDACDMFLDELGSARAGPTVTTDGAASRATTRPSH